MLSSHSLHTISGSINKMICIVFENHLHFLIQRMTFLITLLCICLTTMAITLGPRHSPAQHIVDDHGYNTGKLRFVALTK